VVLAQRPHNWCVLIPGIFAAVVLGLVALACWRAALSTVALVVTSAAAVIVTLALFSTPARIVWSDIFALAFIGATVAAALILQKRRRYSSPAP
jgi:hypothetical protein